MSWRRTYLVLSIVGLLAIAVALAAPLLAARVRMPHLDWAQASEIGQAYGVVSALLAALALTVVGVSAVLQVRAVNQGRIQATRELHARLIERALDDPELAECWGADHSESFKQSAYVNQILVFWKAAWEMGDLHETNLRSDLSRLFTKGPGYQFWSKNGMIWADNLAGSKGFRFVEIVDEEHQRHGSTHQVGDDEMVPQETDQVQRARVVLALVGLAAGTVLGVLATRKLHSKRLPAPEIDATIHEIADRLPHGGVNTPVRGCARSVFDSGVATYGRNQPCLAAAKGPDNWYIAR